VAFGSLLAACGSTQSGTSSLPSGVRAPSVIATITPSPTPTPTPSPVPTATPLPPAGTLYAAVTDRAYAYALNAPSGTLTAQRTIVPHPNQVQVLTGVATNADGTLDILENFFTGTGMSQVAHCRVVVESATADGSPAALGTYLCDPADKSQAEGIARNTIGGFDVLFDDVTANEVVLRRFSADGGTVSSTLILDFVPLYVATDRGGHDYLDTSGGRIVSYKATTTDPTVRASDVTLAGNPSLGPIAVSPNADRTVYVVQGSLGSENVYALAPGSSTISRTIGPFTARYVSALAVDSQGNLYVGTNYYSGAGSANSSIQVYGPSANGTPAPARVLVPSPTTNFIRGLAISE
jgi:hypothetical protein